MKQLPTLAKIIYLAVILPLLAAALVSLTPCEATAAKARCQPACAAALKATGNSSRIKYKSENPMDFGGFSASVRKKAVSFMYVCDAKEVYSICVAKAESPTGAKALLKALNTYKKSNCNSGYLSDYSKTEQKVLKNAVCGRKGNYVWYIAMSSSKSVNIKGQKALKKKV